MCIRIGSGSTEPGNTDWKPYNDRNKGVYVDVDTSQCNFTKTPNYVISIAGKSHLWETTGGSSVYNPKPDGFRVYIRFSSDKLVTPEKANGWSWHINWVGVEN
jgi:hypothetical protein